MQRAVQRMDPGKNIHVVNHFLMYALLYATLVFSEEKSEF